MRALIDRIEALIHRDVGRGHGRRLPGDPGRPVGREPRRWPLRPRRRIGLITGFFVPGGDPPAAETDGPAGAALLALGFIRAGLTCRLATDTRLPVRLPRRAGLRRARPRSRSTPWRRAASSTTLIDLWRGDGIDWVIAIERCGPGSRRTSHGTCAAPISPPMPRRWTGCSAPAHGEPSRSATAATRSAWAACPGT